MTKWIIFFFIIYILLGFTTLLAIQIYDSKVSVSERWFYGLEDSGFIMSVIIIGWPFFLMTGLFLTLIPCILIKLYKLYVLIIFSAVALFKKEKKE